MFDYLFAPGNAPFTIALGLMVAMTLIEIFSASLGMGLSEMVDSFLPEFDADIDLDVDGIDAADSGSASGSVIKLLSWFRIGEVPVIMLFIVFLTGFGLSGLTVQYAMRMVTGVALPTFGAAAIAVATAVPVVRFCGGLLAKYMPKDETYAVSEKSFHGAVVTLTLGTAGQGKPAQAKLRDQYGQTHYVMVEPDDPAGSFSEGDQAIIVGQEGVVYKVIGAAGAAAVDDE